MKNAERRPEKSKSFYKFMLRLGIFQFLFIYLITITFAQGPPETSIPEARTIWEFMDEYTGENKDTRLLNSFAVGTIGCSGTLISPHIFMTAAHCGGPDIWTRNVRFFRIDEDKTPSPSNQRESEPYIAHAFPWQSFIDKTGPQIGDIMLWWLEDGSDGIPPGIKYGYVGLSPQNVNVGDQAYSFWVNPVHEFQLGSTLLHSFGSASIVGTPGAAPPEFFTMYDIFAVPGASGSSVIGADRNKHQVVGVTAIADTSSRTAADTSSFLAAFDSDNNEVLDVIEYDLMLTASPRSFYNLRFDTPLQRAQWHSTYDDSPSSLTSLSDGWAFHVGGKLIGPYPYLSFGDSPFRTIKLQYPDREIEIITSLEDFEDGRLNTTGVRASAGNLIGPGVDTDSVDSDDGTKDYSGTGGYSFFSNNGQAGITFTFDTNTLGFLPTYAGVVWTDGDGTTTFEAFDVNGNSLGKIGPVAIADDIHTGTTREDRFFGAIERSGISAIKIWNSSGGIEVDHLQYGFTKVPIRRLDGSEHYNARFVPNATYRISMAVYALATDGLPAYIKFQSDSSRDALILPFEPELNRWKRVTRRVTLRNHPDYRFVLGSFGNGSYYVDSIAIVREDGGARLDFETDEERRSWESVGGSYTTSWGIDGADDFSGMVVGHSPVQGWSLRNRYAAFQANRTYNIAFDVVHVSGTLETEHFMKVQNLSGITADEISWVFSQNNERKTQTLQVSTGNESGYGIVFGTTGDARYIVDNIRIEEIPEAVPEMAPLGPRPYLSQSDSLFNLSGLGIDFFLEDFEDGKLNTPGAIASTEAVLVLDNLTDSVDNDDGAVDGLGRGGRSLFFTDGLQGIMIAFDEHVLGSLPTQAGIVWTDGGQGQTTFEAFDANWNSLGIIGPSTHADNGVEGQTAEDRFYGAMYPDGIRGILVMNTKAGGIEVDHLQYGLSSVITPPCNPAITGNKTGEDSATHSLIYDGNSTTYFNSSHDNWQYVQVDFNCVGTLHGIRRLMTHNGIDIGGNRGNQGEGFSYSQDGVNWTDFTGDTTHGWDAYVNYAPHAWHSVKYGWSPWLRLNSSVQARYVRFNWDDNFDAVNEIDIDFVSP